jgi:hypothetical protein
MYNRCQRSSVNGKSGSATKFAWGFRGGVLLNASEKIGIKLSASLLSAVQGAGAGVYLGTGGAGAGVSTYSSMYQFALGGSFGGKSWRLEEIKKLQVFK